jgi:5-formyltetrahydrofolate cyclo-ligase
MGETAAEKARLRAELLAVRAGRSPSELAQARAAVRAHVLGRVGEIGRVAAYVPLRTEPGSVELLAELAARGIEVIVPVTLPDRDLDWTPWSPGGGDALLGVEAIGAVGLVLVPGLAVAVDGTRLGRGGGSYDRALARCSPGTIVAVLVFDDEIVAQLPSDPWDMPVPSAVTPSGWVTLRGNVDVGFGR